MSSVQVNVRGTDDLSGLSSYVVQINTTTTSKPASEPASEPEPACNFDGVIVFSQPLSINEDDSKYGVAHLQQVAYEMTIDKINSPPRCGVAVGNKRYSVALATYGDNSSKEMVKKIAQSLISTNKTGFLLGPYSSGLTKNMSPIVNGAKRVFVAAGSTQTPVFEGNEYVFGTLGPSNQKLEAAIRALAEEGAETISVVHEEESPCHVPELAEKNGLKLVMNEAAGKKPSPEDLDPFVKNLTTFAPDVDISVACGYGSFCGNWVKSMRSNNFSPKSQLFATCTDQVRADVGMDVAYMMAGTDWHPTMKGKDEVTGWSVSEFNTTFGKRSYRAAAYQSAAASASISVVVQAIERTGTMDDDILREFIANAYFPTVKSNLTFDNNGQAAGDSVMLQFIDGPDSSEAVVVYPPEKAADGSSIIYPMPTWEEKDCLHKSQCEVKGIGTCHVDGTCICTKSDARSIGVGPNATCTKNEDFTNVDDAYYAVGYSLFAMQTLLSLFFMAWTLIFRRRTIVKASQPEYMAVICFGVWIIACGILPLSSQKGGYRYMQDESTGELIKDELDKDIYKLDAACMAYPWLFAIGFALTFGALFAKVWRINKLMVGASAYRRTQVGVKDVAGFVIGLLAVETLIMLTWQLVDPLQWQRKVVDWDSGYPVKSVGLCTSENGNGKHFIIVLAVVNLSCLLFALYMCYQVRKIPSDYQESKWITSSIISMFQVGIIGVPVLVIVQEDTDALYFVNVMILFLISSTVTLLMFGPKFYQFHVRLREAAASNTNSDDTPEGAKPKRIFALIPAKSRRSDIRGSISNDGSKKDIAKTNEEWNKQTEEENQSSHQGRKSSVTWASNVNDVVTQDS